MNNGGVLLGGGEGTRLFPTTKYINKHLIPIYDKPMIYYSLSILLLSGIRKITLVCSDQDEESFKLLLGNGIAEGPPIILYCELLKIYSASFNQFWDG